MATKWYVFLDSTGELTHTRKTPHPDLPVGSSEKELTVPPPRYEWDTTARDWVKPTGWIAPGREIDPLQFYRRMRRPVRRFFMIHGPTQAPLTWNAFIFWSNMGMRVHLDHANIDTYLDELEAAADIPFNAGDRAAMIA